MATRGTGEPPMPRKAVIHAIAASVSLALGVPTSLVLVTEHVNMADATPYAGIAIMLLPDLYGEHLLAPRQRPDGLCQVVSRLLGRVPGSRGPSLIVARIPHLEGTGSHIAITLGVP